MTDNVVGRCFNMGGLDLFLRNVGCSLLVFFHGSVAVLHGSVFVRLDVIL